MLRSTYSECVHKLSLFGNNKFVISLSDVLQQGWALDLASQMLTVKKQAVITEQKLDPSKLQRLTEYVFHLEH
ncbi:hypothetical protein KY290_002898 [Solanum tuberosum]|uniref:Uncharacterized protein n=1 Tax=Solanum tuberosum TaxID=4113 RepID=A0ABQ7WTL2_SOLTU|nr:hypothetical protein KY290_002898 [Solanum tuberosum]